MVGQFGTNACGNVSNPSSVCQTAWIKLHPSHRFFFPFTVLMQIFLDSNLDDFCLWGPSNNTKPVENTAPDMVAWCLQGSHGARIIPDGTLTGAHFVYAPGYAQVTGIGDMTKLNVLAGSPYVLISS
jgi:hypothetical protein